MAEFDLSKAFDPNYEAPPSVAPDRDLEWVANRDNGLNDRSLEKPYRQESIGGMRFRIVPPNRQGIDPVTLVRSEIINNQYILPGKMSDYDPIPW